MKNVVFLLFIFVFITVFAQTFKEHKSIHQIQSEKFKNVKPQFFYNNQNFYANKKAKKPIVNKRVVGYLASWSNGTKNIKYPLLTDLIYFSCKISTTGAIENCDNWAKSAPIAEAHSYGVKVMLAITGFEKTGVYNLLSSKSKKEAFFKKAYSLVSDAGADGINIDIEVSSGPNGESIKTLLPNFLDELALYFHNQDCGMSVSSILPAVDWKKNYDFSLMNHVNFFFIMGYDYHWSGGNPGPVAPLYSNSPWPKNGICVEKTIADYKDGIGVDGYHRIILGMPYYGVNWLSKSSSFPTTKLANGKAVIYSNVIAPPYTSYTSKIDSASESAYKIYDNSGWHQLWYDNSKTINKKILKAKEEELGGVGMWALNYDGTSEYLWKTIAKNFTDKKDGSIANPKKITKFPFTDTDNTYYYVSDKLNKYECDKVADSDTKDESGPEIIYQLETKCKGFVTVELTDGNSGREDMDIHLLNSLQEDGCIDRDDQKLSDELDKGIYFLSVDSFVSSGVQKGGEFSIKVSFKASNPVNECETGDNNCDKNANCIDTECSFKCECKDGYEGDGVNCKKIENDEDILTDEDVLTDNDFETNEIDTTDEILSDNDKTIDEDLNNQDDTDSVDIEEKDDIQYGETGEEIMDLDNPQNLDSSSNSGCSCSLIVF